MAIEKENKKRIILGLDVSTSTIGISVVLDDGSDYGKIIELTHVAPKVKKEGIEGLFMKKQIFQEEFLNKWKDCGITDVVIEEPLMRSNNLNTCATLMRFNSMIADSVYTTFNGLVPKFISSYHARLFAFPDLYNVRKFKRDGEKYNVEKILSSLKDNHFALFGAYPWDLDKKVILQQKMAEIFPEIEWLYNKKGELKQENYDSVDAYVCVLGLLNMEKHPSEDNKIEVKVSNIIQRKTSISYDVTYWNKTEKRKIYI